MFIYGVSYIKYDFNNDCASRGDILFSDNSQGVEKFIDFISQKNLCFEITNIDKVFIDDEKKA